MGVRCSSPSTASSSTPDRLRPTLPPEVPVFLSCVSMRCVAAISIAVTSSRCIASIHVDSMWSPVHPQPRAAAREHDHLRARLRPGSDVLWLVTSRRSVVEYGLARRATLASVYGGRTTVTDVCDAHPYLLRAAKFHGEPTEDRCPICRKAKL